MRTDYYEANKKSISKAEIAAMPKVLFPGRIFVVYTESDAEKAVAYLKDQRIVGVDTETRLIQTGNYPQGGIIANFYSGHLFSVQA